MFFNGALSRLQFLSSVLQNDKFALQLIAIYRFRFVYLIDIYNVIDDWNSEDSEINEIIAGILEQHLENMTLRTCSLNVRLK